MQPVSQSLPAPKKYLYNQTNDDYKDAYHQKDLSEPKNQSNLVQPVQITPQSYSILNNDRKTIYNTQNAKLIIIKNLSNHDGLFTYKKTYFTSENNDLNIWIQCDFKWARLLQGPAFYTCYDSGFGTDCIFENEKLTKYDLQYHFSERTLGKYLENIKSTTGENFQEFCNYKHHVRIFQDFRELIKGLCLVHNEENYHGNICFEQIAVDDGFKFLPFTPKKLEYEFEQIFGQERRVTRSLLFSDQKLTEVNYLDVNRNKKSDIYALGLVLLQILLPEIEVLEMKNFIVAGDFEILGKYADLPILSELIKKMIDLDCEKRPDCNQCLNLLNSAELLSCLHYFLQSRASLEQCKYKPDYKKNTLELRIETNEQKSYFKVWKNANNKEKLNLKNRNIYKLNESVFGYQKKNIQPNEICLSYEINLKSYSPLKNFQNKFVGIYKILQYSVLLLHSKYFHKKLTLDMIYFDNQSKFWFGGAEYLKPIEKHSKTKINYDEDFIRFLPPELDDKNLLSCNENYSYMKVYSFNVGMIISDFFYLNNPDNIDKYNAATEIFNKLREQEYYHLSSNIYYLLNPVYDQRKSISDINFDLIHDEIYRLNYNKQDYGESDHLHQSPNPYLDSEKKNHSDKTPPKLISSRVTNLKSNENAPDGSPSNIAYDFNPMNGSNPHNNYLGSPYH